MNHTENLTRYTANFVDELVCSGLRHVVISPGSRSTPLAILCTEHEEIKEWVLIDERSAAYFALGIAKHTNEPVALVCTSGTAAANYFPAIVEAYYARVPLIVLTADRPHELRGVGASQTINQVQMYGDFVKKSWEMALPEATPSMLQYVRNRAARVFQDAIGNNAGPVHVNFPFREPLLPDLTLTNVWGMQQKTSYNVTYEGEKRLPKPQLEKLASKLLNKRGVIVCGPQMDEHLATAIVKLSDQLQAPILADPLSQLRTGAHDKANVIATYDSIFRSKQMRETLAPDYIIRFGAMPISKSYLFYVQEHADALQIVVEDFHDTREPTNHQSEYIFANSHQLCEDLLPYVVNHEPEANWLKTWQQLDAIAAFQLQRVVSSELTEGETIRNIMEMAPNDSVLFVANSMPVRDVDTFLGKMDKQLHVHANRGTSGIDGTMSTAIGVAATLKQHVTLIVGDLSFYHDMNSLFAAKHYDIDITIILINNNGGGIFSFLPQAKEGKHFEALFGTPLHLDFAHVAQLYESSYDLITSQHELEEAVQRAWAVSGISIIEVQTDRDENAIWHRSVWSDIETRLHAYDLTI